MENNKKCKNSFKYLDSNYLAGHPDQFLKGRYFQPTIFDIYDENPTKRTGKYESWSSYNDFIKPSPINTNGTTFEKPQAFSKKGNVLKPLIPNKKTTPHESLLNTIGILYYDRIRFRNVGITLGEHITTISLAPGEEINFSQHSETRKTNSFEENSTQEQDQESSVSSVWATDISSEYARSSTTSIGGNAGVNAGFKIPELDFLQIGADAGGDINLTFTDSSNKQTQYAHELSHEMARKSRQEHKTTFKIGTENILEASSTRTLTNQNDLYSVNYHIYKLYNKQRVILERHNAKLSLNLSLTNPAQEILALINAALDDIDPNLPKNYSCTTPALSSFEEHTYTINVDDPPFFAGPTVHYISRLGSKVVHAIPPSNDLVFSHADAPELLEWEIQHQWDGSIERVNISEFSQYGGSLNGPYYEDRIPLAPGKVDVTFDFESAMSLWAGPLTVGSWWTTSLKFKTKFYFVPKKESSENYHLCVDSERQRLKDNLTPELLNSILLVDSESIKNNILLQIIKKYFSFGILNNKRNTNSFLVKEFRNYFSWNEVVIQQFPHWMSGQESSQLTLLVKRINKLLPGYNAKTKLPDILSARSIQLILPINHGFENFVFSLLTNKEWDSNNFVSTFKNFHEINFGSIAYPLPSYTDILSPEKMPSTEIGAQDWENNWEKPRSKYVVLDEWSEYTPTDGTHIEPVLSSCSSADELREEEVRNSIKAYGKVSSSDLKNL